MNGIRVLFITAPAGDEAVRIARQLVEERLAACVNVVPGVRSFYWWEGAVQDDAEDLLVVKAPAERVAALIRRVREIHPYGTPETIAVPVTAGNEDYVAWVLREASPRAPGGS